MVLASNEGIVGENAAIVGVVGGQVTNKTRNSYHFYGIYQRLVAAKDF